MRRFAFLLACALVFACSGSEQKPPKGQKQKSAQTHVTQLGSCLGERMSINGVEIVNRCKYWPVRGGWRGKSCGGSEVTAAQQRGVTDYLADVCKHK